MFAAVSALLASRPGNKSLTQTGPTLSETNKQTDKREQHILN